jgi:Cu/Ag efflux protein CusF
MTARTTTVLVGMLWMAAVALPVAQAPVTKANVLKISATIQAIDSTTRSITLRDDKGNEDTFTVGDAVQRFNELKVGQKVNITYYESIVFQLLKPGEAGGGTSVEAALDRAKSALPAGTVAVQDKATVTVKAVDPAVPSITVTTADGRTVTRKIENKKNIEGVKAGDKIDITFTRALVTSVENAK